VADRAKRRAAMVADPAWQAYAKKSAEADLLVSQQNRITHPTDFSPV